MVEDDCKLAPLERVVESYRRYVSRLVLHDDEKMSLTNTKAIRQQVHFLYYHRSSTEYDVNIKSVYKMVSSTYVLCYSMFLGFYAICECEAGADTRGNLVGAGGGRCHPCQAEMVVVGGKEAGRGEI